MVMRGNFMETTNIMDRQNASFTMDDAVNVLFSKLDEAIDDMENGRALTEEELWAEIDLIE